MDLTSDRGEAEEEEHLRLFLRSPQHLVPLSDQIALLRTRVGYTEHYPGLSDAARKRRIFCLETEINRLELRLHMSART